MEKYTGKVREFCQFGKVGTPTLIRIPNQMAIFYHAEHFTLHELGLRSLLPTSV